MKRRLIIAAAAVGSLAVAGCSSSSSSSTAASSGGTTSASAAAKTCVASIGLEAPITGSVAPLGQEQLHFAQLAVAMDNAARPTMDMLAAVVTAVMALVQMTHWQAGYQLEN